MNFLIYLINEGLSKVLPFITILIVAKHIDAEAFGELTLYFIVFELLIILISNNITATTRIDYFKLSFSNYVESKSTHLVVSFFIFLCVLVVGLFFSNMSYLFLSMLSLSAFLRTVSYYHLSNLQCKEDAKSYGISNVIYLLSMNGLFVILILLDYGINSWFYGILFGSFTQFLYSLMHIKKLSLFIYEKDIILKKDNLLKEFKYGLIFIPQAVGFWMKFGIDRVLLVYFTSTLIVGYYMFAYQLLLPIVILGTVINLYLTPKINKLLKLNSIQLLKKNLILFSFLIIVFSVFIYFGANFVISSFYYEKYMVSLEYLPYMIISIVFQSIMMVYLNIFYYIDKKEFVSKFIFITALFQIIGGMLIINISDVFGLMIFNIIYASLSLLFIINIFNRRFNVIA